MSPARYNANTGDEEEFEPGSRGRVLKNRLSIKRKMAMDEAEVSALVRAQATYLDQITNATVFTADMICQMHYDWLGEIYPWAGTYRSVELSKGGFSWPPAFRVANNMARFEEQLLKPSTPFRAKSLAKDVIRLAEIHAEILLIHPFREGNGRLARWLADLMCLQADLPQPDYGFVGVGSRKCRRAYLDAVIQGYQKNYRPLADFFRDALERSTSG
ncbi:MAG: Fic family protein [Opitutales bacterium]